MKFVGAGFHGDVQCAAAAKAELGVHAVLLHGHFLHGIHRRHVGAARPHTQGHAVQQHVIVACCVSTDIQAVRRPHVKRVAVLYVPVVVHHSRIEKSQRERIARQHRQLVEHLAVDGLGHGAGGELDLVRGLADRHRLRDVTQLQCHIHRDVAAGQHLNLFLNESVEASGLRRHAIRARRHQIEDIRAPVAYQLF